jgi:hypothetical protein
LGAAHNLTLIDRIQPPATGETVPAMMEGPGPALEVEFGARCEILKARLDPEPSLRRTRLQAAGKAAIVNSAKHPRISLKRNA